MKLITEIIKSKLVEEQTNFGWDTSTHHLFNDLIKLCNELKTAEINNIEAAVRYGTNIPNHMFLDMEVYDHIKYRYDEESMTDEELDKCKKSIDFWQKYLEESAKQPVTDSNDLSSPKTSDN